VSEKKCEFYLDIMRSLIKDNFVLMGDTFDGIGEGQKGAEGQKLQF